MLVLSGGRGPRRMYELLAGDTGDRVPWAEVSVLWGDERCVPPDDERSNYRLAASAGLLARPLAAVYRMPGELDPEEGALAYEAQVRGLFPTVTVPRLDVVLLGLGADGHTASLFPGSPALLEWERLVIATEEQGGVRRLTLTLPALAAARELLFLVTGEAKASAVRSALEEGGPEADRSPARLLMDLLEGGARAGRKPPAITWVLDEAAASLLVDRGGHLDGGSARG